MSKRRVWSDDKKQELVAETKVEGVSVASVARKHRVSASQLAQWIRDPRFNGDSTRPRIEIILLGGHRIVIEGVFDPASVVPLVHSFVA